MNRRINEGTVTFGEAVAVIKRNGSSSATVAKVLEVKRDSSGQVLFAVLDRIVHRPGESKLGPYDVRGAITSELSLSAA